MQERTFGAVIVSFNQRDTLHEAVRSAQAQTLAFERIVVVDDGSTEADALDKVSCLPGIEIVEQANAGVAAARNTGARALGTDLVAVLDGDDVWKPGWAAAVAERFDDAEVVAVSSWLQAFGSIDAVIRPAGGDSTGFLARNNCPASVAFRRSRWEACGGYDETMRRGFEDWDFALRLLKPGGWVDIVPEPLIRYRTAPTSDNIKGQTRRAELYRSIIDRHRALFAEHHVEALLQLQTIATTRLSVAEDLLSRHVDEDVQPIATYGDGGMAAAVRVATARAQV